MVSTYRSSKLWFFLLIFAIIFIAGCASPQRALTTFDAKSSQWQGRLALKVQSTPPQALSANFDLQGNAQNGSLALSTALGSTLASMQWGPGFAMLQTTVEPTQFESLPALVRHVTGTDVPINNLFHWLRGETSEAPGWEVDYSDLNQGRLTARRTGSQGDAELKIILDR